MKPSVWRIVTIVTIFCIGLTSSLVVAKDADGTNATLNGTTSRVAVVTGGNKGIGFAIVKGLCERFDGIVYLTARNEELGRAAVEELKKLGLQPRFHQLDINENSSVDNFAKYLNDTHGGLDVLVDNAGITSKSPSQTVEVNYFGLLRVSKAVFPLLRPHARVVQVSSAMGHLSEIPGDDLKARLSSLDLTEDGLSQLMRDFVESQKAGTHEAAGWPDDAYTVSKVGVAALTRIQQRSFDEDEREDLVVNAVHPGYVSTDLTKHLGTFTPERGAQAPLYLALLPKNTDVKGKYVWHDNTIVDWANGPKPAPY